MKYRIIVLAMVAALSLPALAQWNNNDVIATAPTTTTFQSTSTLGSSNSAYSSNPSISDNGTATIRTIGVRRNETPSGNPGTPDEDEIDDDEKAEWQPIGDAVWPLLLLALAYVGVRARRRVVNKV
ncbi:MAG: hypothetical protein J6W92_04255 [Paludibacteraceae bacterium]|nr:hypothetical protein [Paludibacteraceae bacterium]